MRRSRVLLVALTAALALTAGASTASANRSLQAIAAERDLNSIRKHALALSFNNGFEEAICEVIRVLRHHRDIAKTPGSLLGMIISAGTMNCRGGPIVRVPGQERFENANWHKVFTGFTGTLPAITSVRTTVRGVTFLMQVISGCQYRGDVRFTTGGAAMTELRIEGGTATIPLERELPGAIFCEPVLRIRGSLATTPRVTYRLN